MSGRDTSSSSSATTLAIVNDKYHADFSSPTADFVVLASDSVKFKCHKLFLQEASPVFRTMLSLPQPASHTAGASTLPDAKLPSIDLPEDSMTLEILLRMIYPMTQPVIESTSALAAAFFAAEKYDMAGIISTLRLHLRDFVNDEPVYVFALACRFGFVQEAKSSSRATLTVDVHDTKNTEIFQQTGFKVTDLISLHSLRHKRIDGMREFLDGDRFEGNAPDFTCVTCDKKLNDITWPLLKATILKELYRRPLGDTIFSPDFLKSSAIQSFINSKCEECQERLIYEKGKTLAMISEYLKSLPESIDIQKPSP